MKKVYVYVLMSFSKEESQAEATDERSTGSFREKEEESTGSWSSRWSEEDSEEEREEKGGGEGGKEGRQALAMRMAAEADPFVVSRRYAAPVQGQHDVDVRVLRQKLRAEEVSCLFACVCHCNLLLVPPFPPLPPLSRPLARSLGQTVNRKPQTANRKP